MARSSTDVPSSARCGVLTYPLPTMRATRTGQGHSHVGRIGGPTCVVDGLGDRRQGRADDAADAAVVDVEFCVEIDARSGAASRCARVICASPAVPTVGSGADG